MAKKQAAPKLRRGVVYNKKTDTQEVRFYNSEKHGKKATEAEVRAYIKANFDNLDASQLSKADRQYYGRIKGGKARAADTPRIDGKYISDLFAANTGITDQAAHDAGYKNRKEFLAANPDLYKATKALSDSKTGLPFPTTSWSVLKLIDEFGGHIFINGEPVTKLQALATIDAIDKAILRTPFDVYLVEYTVYYRKGGSEMHINIPELEAIEQTEDLEELNELLTTFGHEAHASNKKYTNKLPKDANPNRFKYKLEIVEQKEGKLKRSTKTITAYDIKDAVYKAKKDFPDKTIARIERKAKTKPRPKKKK